MSTEHGVLINGRWVPGGRHIHVVEKYTGRHLAAITRARSGHVAQAVSAAAEAMAAGVMAVEDRGAVLRCSAAELAKQRSAFALLLTKETGKPLVQSYVEVDEAAAALHYAAALAAQGRQRGGGITDLATPFIVSDRCGRGVTAIVSSRIDPLLAAAAAFGAVFAAGNSCIVKPAQQTPLTTIMLCQILIQAGVPSGYLNLLVGSGRSTGERLLKDERVICGIVTGTATTLARARLLMGQRHFVGWHNTAAMGIVFADADVETAAETCVAQAFEHSGQRFRALERIYVHEALYDTFVTALNGRVTALVLGDPLDSGTHIGCMMDMAQADRVSSWVDEAVRAGAEAVTPIRQRGNQIAPTIVTAVPNDSKLFRERLAGPVVTIHRFSDNEAPPVLREDTDALLLFTSSPGNARQHMAAFAVPELSVYGRRAARENSLTDRTRRSMDALFRHVSIERHIAYHW